MMDDVDQAKQMAQSFLLEAAKEHNADRAPLLVSVARTWLDVLSTIEGREVTAAHIITVDHLLSGLTTTAQL
jgi:hypothetical protein